MKVVRAAAILAAFGAILAFQDDNMVASKVLFSAKYRSKALRWASDLLTSIRASKYPLSYWLMTASNHFRRISLPS